MEDENHWNLTGIILQVWRLPRPLRGGILSQQGGHDRFVFLGKKRMAEHRAGNARG